MKQLFTKKNCVVVIILGLFSFVFLGTEFYFDTLMAYLTDARGVVNSQNIVLGASVPGFFCFHFINRKLRRVVMTVATAIYLFLMIMMSGHLSYRSLLIEGITVFVILGLYGSSVCYQTILSIKETKSLARIVGISYAFGIAIQFISNNLLKSATIQMVLLIIAILILEVIVVLLKDDDIIFSEADINVKDIKKSDDKKSLTTSLICITVLVILMTIIFSTLDNAVTLVHASGEFDIGQWPRLLLAVSAIVAGILFDINDRRFMVPIMYEITLLSTISVIIIQFGGVFVLGLFVFYISAGFLVVFFMTAYMDVSERTRCPDLWAGMGRAVNNACAFATSFLSVRFLTNENQMEIMIFNVILFVLISVVSGYYVFRIQSDERIRKVSEDKTKVADSVKGFDEFVLQFGLTDREKNILQKLLYSDDDVQNIAAQLSISRTALYRHISTMNEKTDTKNRVGLIQFYHSWIEE